VQGVRVGSGSTSTRVRYSEKSSTSSDPSWSPEGSRILFSIGGWETSGGGGAQYGGTLYLVGADGSNLTRLTDDGRFWWAADWSPDGRLVVSMGATPTGSADPYDWVDSGVYVMAADGSDIRLLGEKLWGRTGMGARPDPVRLKTRVRVLQAQEALGAFEDQLVEEPGEVRLGGQHGSRPENCLSGPLR